MRSAYGFLRRIAFRDTPLPPARAYRFIVRAGDDWLAMHATQPRRIWMDPSIRRLSLFLYKMAHEMCHGAIDGARCCDTSDHGVVFRELAASVEREMGWPKGSV